MNEKRIIPTNGPYVWHYARDVIEGFVVSVKATKVPSGWIVTDLCVSVSPDPTLIESGFVQIPKDSPVLSTWASYPAEEKHRGITSTVLQRIRISELRDAIAAQMDEAGLETEDPVWSDWYRELSNSMKGARRQHDDRFYAQVAAAYVDAHRTSHSVYKELARHLPYAESTLRDIVKECRTKDLLTVPDTPGRAGGKLTEKARNILMESADGTYS